MAGEKMTHTPTMEMRRTFCRYYRKTSQNLGDLSGRCTYLLGKVKLEGEDAIQLCSVVTYCCIGEAEIQRDKKPD